MFKIHPSAIKCLILAANSLNFQVELPALDLKICLFSLKISQFIYLKTKFKHTFNIYSAKVKNLRDKDFLKFDYETFNIKLPLKTAWLPFESNPLNIT